MDKTAQFLSKKEILWHYSYNRIALDSRSGSLNGSVFI
jgi:hypothetical protein